MKDKVLSYRLGTNIYTLNTDNVQRLYKNVKEEFIKFDSVEEESEYLQNFIDETFDFKVTEVKDEFKRINSLSFEGKAIEIPMCSESILSLILKFIFITITLGFLIYMKHIGG